MDNPSEKETRRINALQDYQILDTAPESDFDELVGLASEICGTPISLISLLDSRRQWFKARRGLEATETPREQAFCAYAIQQPDQVMVVTDPTHDPRFQDNPLVTGDPKIRFYAGAPLVDAEGYAFGTLCVIDQQPRTLTDKQLTALRILANQVVAQMELRKKMRALEQSNDDLSQQARIVSHDLRSPINNLESIVNLLAESYRDQLDKKGQKLVAMASQQLSNLKSMVTGILRYSLYDQESEEKTWVDFNTLLACLANEFATDNTVTIQLQNDYPTLLINEAFAQQIFRNLITNAIKYNDNDMAIIKITALSQSTTQWKFTVTDNGRGIPEKFMPKLFDLFQTQRTQDRYGQVGTGLGLAMVKKLVERNGGSIRAESTEGKGTEFIFTLAGEVR